MDTQERARSEGAVGGQGPGVRPTDRGRLRPASRRRGLWVGHRGHQQSCLRNVPRGAQSRPPSGGKGCIHPRVSLGVKSATCWRWGTFCRLYTRVCARSTFFFFLISHEVRKISRWDEGGGRGGIGRGANSGDLVATPGPPRLVYFPPGAPGPPRANSPVHTSAESRAALAGLRSICPRVRCRQASLSPAGRQDAVY